MVRRMTPVAEGRVRKILFLTDGKNDGKNHRNLKHTVTECRKAEHEVTAWGVGTAWDRPTGLHRRRDPGQSEHHPHRGRMRNAFTTSFAEMRRLAANNVRLHLWTPVDVGVRSVQQVFPIVRSLRADTGNLFPLGSMGHGEQRDYLVELAIPVHTPGQHYVISRPILSYEVSGHGRVEEPASREGWLFLHPTLDGAEAARIEPHVAHYTHGDSPPPCRPAIPPWPKATPLAPPNCWERRCSSPQQRQ